LVQTDVPGKQKKNNRGLRTLACFKGKHVALRRAAQQELHEPAAAIQAPLDGSRGEEQMVGDPFDGPTLKVVEVEDGCVLLGELGERGPHGGVLSLSDHLVDWMAGREVAVGVEERLHLGGIGWLAAATAYGNAPGAAAGDHIQPVTELLGVLELRQSPEGLQECVLGDVFRAVARTGGLLGHRKHRAAVASDELVEGGGVTAASLLYQFFVTGVGVGSGHGCHCCSVSSP
jgi:hypothetical protein